MRHNFRDEDDKTTLLEFKLRCKTDNLNNRQHINQFERDMDYHKVEYKSWENPHTGAYWINGVVTNRLATVWEKTLLFFRTLI